MASAGRRHDRVQKKTRKLIDRLKADSDNMSVEYLLGCPPEYLPRPPTSYLRELLRDLRSLICDPLRDLLISPASEPRDLLTALRSHRDLIIGIVEAEAEARTHTHADICSESRSLDNLYQKLVGRYLSQPSRTPDKLTDILGKMLTRVCHIMAVEDPLCAFRPRGVGSHHDGTKVSRHGDVDFILVSLYRPGEGSTDRLGEDYIVEYLDDNRSTRSILPVEGSGLHRLCVDTGLLDGRQLNTSNYRKRLFDLLSSVIDAVGSEVGLPFGGPNKPYFGVFEKNGPAWTVLVDGVSVDITVAFAAPKDIADGKGNKVMEEIAEKVSSRVPFMLPSTGSNEDRPAYVNMGLLVLSDVGHCQLSTTIVESHLLRTVPQLQCALKVCKVYKDYFFDLPWPNLTPYFNQLEDTVLKWLLSGGCSTLLESVPSDPHLRLLDKLESQAEALLLLATQSRPLTVHDRIVKNIQQIKQTIRERIYYRFVHPSLWSLVLVQPPKPIVKTTSFVFKTLILNKWITNPTITTQELVSEVIQEYSKQSKLNVEHPQLSPWWLSWPPSVEVVKTHSFCVWDYLDIKESVLSIHKKNVEQIVNQISAKCDCHVEVPQDTR